MIKTKISMCMKENILIRWEEQDGWVEVHAEFPVQVIGVPINPTKQSL